MVENNRKQFHINYLRGKYFYYTCIILVLQRITPPL